MKDLAPYTIMSSSSCYYTNMNIDDELSFAMGSKLNVGDDEWTKLVERKQRIEEFMFRGRGDCGALYRECLSQNDTYLRLVKFDANDPSEYLIMEFLKRSIAPGLCATKCLEYSLRAYEIVVATIDGPDNNDESDEMQM